jgi:hypothetical protein
VFQLIRERTAPEVARYPCPSSWNAERRDWTELLILNIKLTSNKEADKWFCALIHNFRGLLPVCQTQKFTRFFALSSLKNKNIY